MYRELLATVGEQGPEAIVPLSQLPGIIRESLGLNNGVTDMPPPGVNDAVTDMPLPDQPRYINLPPGAAPPTIMDDPDDTRYVNIPPGTEPPTLISGPSVAPLPPPVYAERDPLLDLMKPGQNGPGSNSNFVGRSGISRVTSMRFARRWCRASARD